MSIERQHYVPQGFLKGFSADNERSNKFVWVYEKLPNRRPRKVSTKSVAWEKFYYAQEDEFGVEDTDTIEKQLAKSIDNEIPKIIKSLNPRPDKTTSFSRWKSNR